MIEAPKLFRRLGLDTLNRGKWIGLEAR